MKLARIYIPFCVLVLLLGGCDGFFPSDSALDSITLAPTNRFMKVNDTQQFTATATTVGGTSSDISSTATWTSSNNSVATVTAGLVTAKSAGTGLGTATITASSGGISKTAVVTVTAAALNSIAITPASPTVTVGATTQLKATGTLADNSTPDVTNFVTWASSDTSKATVSATGLVTGVAAGTATITATAQTGSAVTNSVSLTVQ
jgi:uncharacterized protein YjdB